MLFGSQIWKVRLAIVSLPGLGTWSHQGNHLSERQRPKTIVSLWKCGKATSLKALRQAWFCSLWIQVASQNGMVKYLLRKHLGPKGLYGGFLSYGRSPVVTMVFTTNMEWIGWFGGASMLEHLHTFLLSWLIWISDKLTYLLDTFRFSSEPGRYNTGHLVHEELYIVGSIIPNLG